MNANYLNLIVLYLFSCSFLMAQTTEQLNKDSLKYDFEILENTLLNLHPGLYRYQDSTIIAKHFAEFKTKFLLSKNIKEAFLNLTEFTNSIQCGHTYPNFWNQNEKIQEELFNLNDKVPFTFVIVEDAFLIQKNLSSANLPKGSRVTAINQVPTSEIIAKIWNYSRSDGDNDLKRYVNLSLDGLGKFEAFDIIFPMLFPPKTKQYKLKGIDPSGKTFNISVKSISRAERFRLMEEKYGAQPSKKDELWNQKKLNPTSSYLKLGTFAVWNMDMDWKAYLRDFFQKTTEQNVKNLVIDLRGNEGGLMEVYWELLTYLTDKPLSLQRDKQLVRYQSVPKELRPFLSSWSKDLFDISDKVQQKDNRFYEFKDRTIDVLNIEPSRWAYTNKLVILTDASNSSATFYLSKFIKDNDLGILVGQTTGGNMMGTNGGQMFMLSLPYSKLEVDIPLIGYFPRIKQPNKGLKPNYEVPRNKNFYLSHEDLDIQKALEIFH